MCHSLTTAGERVALAALFVFSATGCTVTHHVSLGPTIAQKEITGMTTRAGAGIKFRPAGARIANDTLRATGPTGPVVIPTDSVRAVWVKEFAWGRTVLLVVGVAAALAVVAEIELLTLVGHWQ